MRLHLGIRSGWVLVSMFVSVFILEIAGASQAFAMKPKTYQISGPVVAFTDSTITIEKSKGERVVFARDVVTHTSGGELKVGDRVTVSYVLSADNIEIEPAKKTDKSSVDATTSAPNP